MQVLLLKDVPKLGRAGQVVSVADGFAQNALLPQRKAVPATGGIVAKVQEKARAEALKVVKQEAVALELKEKLEKRTIIIQAKSAPDGKLFGAVREKDIAEAVSRELGREIAKSQIVISEPIKLVGEHIVKIKFDNTMSVNVRLNIIGD